MASICKTCHSIYVENFYKIQVDGQNLNTVILSVIHHCENPSYAILVSVNILANISRVVGMSSKKLWLWYLNEAVISDMIELFLKITLYPLFNFICVVTVFLYNLLWQGYQINLNNFFIFLQSSDNHGFWWGMYEIKLKYSIVVFIVGISIRIKMLLWP
jgi:hypothetical protein